MKSKARTSICLVTHSGEFFRIYVGSAKISEVGFDKATMEKVRMLWLEVEYNPLTFKDKYRKIEGEELYER